MRSWTIGLVLAAVLAGCATKQLARTCDSEAWKPYGTYERCLEAKALEFERLERQSRQISSWERRDRAPRKDLW